MSAPTPPPSGRTTGRLRADGSNEYLDPQPTDPECSCGKGTLSYPTRYWRDTLKRRRCTWCAAGGFLS